MLLAFCSDAKREIQQMKTFQSFKLTRTKSEYTENAIFNVKHIETVPKY